jgi:subtilase family serine protease
VITNIGDLLLQSSGDDGTGHTGTFWCGTFDANFPASSPYITAVGGTYLTAQTGMCVIVSNIGGRLLTPDPTRWYRDRMAR